MELTCQNPKCRTKSNAVKVCHHSDCRESNGNRPFYLCCECNVEIHSKRSQSGHLCLDIPRKRGHSLQNILDKRSREDVQNIGENDGRIVNHKQRGVVAINQTNEYCDRPCDSSSNCISGHHRRQNIYDESEKKTDCHSSDVNSRSYLRNGSLDRNNDGVSQRTRDLSGLYFHMNGSLEHDDVEHFHEADADKGTTNDSDDDDHVVRPIHRHKFHRSHSISDPLYHDYTGDLLIDFLSNQECFDHGDNDEEYESKRQGDVEELDDNCDYDHQLNQQNGDVGTEIKLVDSDQCSDQSCVEGTGLVTGATVNGQNFEDASQDDDEDFTESESSTLNLKLKRKKAMKIKKTKTSEFVRNYYSLSKIEFQRRARDNRDEETKCRDGDVDHNANSVIRNILHPNASSHAVSRENPTDLKLTMLSNSSRTGRDPPSISNLQADRKDAESEKNSHAATTSPHSKPKDLSENSKSFQRNLLEESRKRHIGPKNLGSSKLDGEFFRKFSLTSEYFTLRFGSDEQMIVAPKGLPLHQAISSIIYDRWGLKIDRCDVFLNSSNSPLPLSSDCYLLANNTLWLKVKSNKKPKNSGNQVTLTSNSHLTSTALSSTEKSKPNGNIKTSKKLGSPDECLSADGFSNYSSLSQSELQKLRSAKGTSRLQSLFQFSKVQEKQEHMMELLTGYSINGLPKMPDLLTLGRPRFDPSIFVLEQHWKDIVADHEMLTKPQRDQQEAIWELLTTEVEYIRKLRVVNDLFMCCLFNLQNEQVLNEIEADKLFSNIDDVYFATCYFWKVHLSQVLQQARKTNEPLNPSLLKSGFVVFYKIFEPYTKYCLEQDMCQDYIRTKTKENELFRNYVQWGQSQEQCRLLRLQDILCGPWQRLMRYRLLLKEILKYTVQIENPTPDDQINDLEIMIEEVEKFVTEVNIALRVREESLQMSKLMNRIESYEVIESPSDECVKLLDKFSKLDLITPVPGCGPREMRMLILEGNLKLKDAFSKMDVYCLLFTDMFLVTKPLSKRSGDKVKIIKPPMRLDKIVVQSLRDPSYFVILYLNEYHMAQALYTFHGDSRLWTETLKRTQNDYKEKRFQYLIRSENNLFMEVDENADEDEAYPAFMDSPSISDVIQTDDSVIRSHGNVLPSNSSLESASDKSKLQFDDSRSSLSALGWLKKSRSTLSLASSTACDQLTLNGKENSASAPRKLHPSPSFSITNSKIWNIDGVNKRNTKYRKHMDGQKTVNGNHRHNSESVVKFPDRDLHLQKLSSWNHDSNSALKILNHTSGSKSPTLPDSRKSTPDAEAPVGKELSEHSNNSCVTFDGKNFGQLSLTRSSSATFDNSTQTNCMRQSASLPVFTKSSPTRCATFDGISEEFVQRMDKAFILEDCTLGSTDV